MLMYKNLYDSHTHSIHSFDGHHTVFQMCKGAINNGLKGIAITDHCDIDGVNEKCWDFEDSHFNDCSIAKEVFKDKLNLYIGVELGQGIFRKELSTKFLDKYDFDVVIGSIHNLENVEDFYFLDFKQYDVDALLKEYFKDILELAKWNKADIIAHLTYPLRYIVEREGYDVDLSKYDDLISEIFETIIKNNKALELNTSGLHQSLADTMPNKALIKKFHDMGGEYVTLGSDSHYYDKVGLEFERGLDILKECGYTHYTIFEKRQPKLIPIE